MSDHNRFLLFINIAREIDMLNKEKTYEKLAKMFNFKDEN